MTTAAPIWESIARLRTDTAKRLGYAMVGICRNCTDVVIMRPGEQLWIHRTTERQTCLVASIRKCSHE
jgi:hypothetical protein